MAGAGELPIPQCRNLFGVGRYGTGEAIGSMSPCTARVGTASLGNSAPNHPSPRSSSRVGLRLSALVNASGSFSMRST